MLVCTITKADVLDKFINSLEEQSTIAEWVVQRAQVKLSQKEALSIVMDTYAYSLSSDLNPKLTLSLIRTESGFIKSAKSNHRAKGLMQIVEKWHKDKLKGRSPFNQTVAIEVGVKILKDCFDKHKQNTFKGLSCYSGGGGKKYHDKVIAFQKDLTGYISNSNTRLYALN